jgi:hypothetical protein
MSMTRDDLILTLRPLDGWEILAKGVTALENNDIETASYIYDYLTSRKREKFAKYFRTMIVNEFNTEPIGFLTIANEIAQKYQSKTKGTNKVYVILLDGYLKNGRYGLYVGQTSRTVSNRLTQHLSGGDLAAKCHKKMKCLLPSLYGHLNPMSKKESLEIEEAIANDFRAVGIRTEGGRKKGLLDE